MNEEMDRLTKELIEQDDQTLKAESVIKKPEQILQIMHEKKQLILLQLFNHALTIQELKQKTGLNPGTIKRYLDQLMKEELVFVEYSKRNEYNILMKFYRTTAKKFRINMLLPDDIETN